MLQEKLATKNASMAESWPGTPEDVSLMDLDVLAREWPPLIPRSEIKKYFNGLYSPKYMANLDSLGLGPPYVKIGRKVAYLREGLIAWLKARITKVSG